MAEFYTDKRDIKFTLFEQTKVEELLKLERYKEISPEDMDMIIDEAEKLAKEVTFPLDEPADAEGVTFKDGKVSVPSGFHPAFKTLREGGWISMGYNPEFGGQGLPVLLAMAASDFFLGSCPSFFLTVMLSGNAGHLIETFGSDEIKKTYCEKMYSGEWAGTMCLTEANAGSDVGNSTTKAVKEGDHYLIEGTKVFITAGDHDLTSNIIHTVLARTPDAPKGTKGLSLFAVPKFRVNPDGSLGDFNNVTCGSVEHKMGLHGSPTCVLNFGDKGPCYGYLLGNERDGMSAMFQMMNEARFFVGVQGLSTAAAAYYNALEYAKERVQSKDFRKMKDNDAPALPIIDHPDVRRMLMTMKAYVEGMRGLCYKAALWGDYHLAGHKDAATYEGLLEILTPIVKAYCTDIGFKVCELAIQTKGGYGYIKEYTVERYMRDIKIASLYEGTNGIQALDFIGRKVSRNMGKNLFKLMGEINDFISKNKENQPLEKEFKKLVAARDKVAEVNMWLLKTAQDDIEIPILNAYPYLNMIATLLMGWVHMERALVAEEKLSAILEAKGQTARSGRRYAKFLAEDADARFYDGKVKAAQFFIHNLMPELYAYADAVTSKDKSALETVF